MIVISVTLSYADEVGGEGGACAGLCPAVPSCPCLSCSGYLGRGKKLLLLIVEFLLFVICCMMVNREIPTKRPTYIFPWLVYSPPSGGWQQLKLGLPGLAWPGLAWAGRLQAARANQAYSGTVVPLRVSGWEDVVCQLVPQHVELTHTVKRDKQDRLAQSHHGQDQPQPQDHSQR